MISDFFKQAELSLAAYANLSIGTPNKILLEEAGMSTIQAATFASTYSVAAQYTDPATGLSATVFQEIATGQKTLAIRGTEITLQDLLTDVIDIALLGTTALQAQYTSLKAKVTEWLGDGTLSPSFTVTGHSLGGFLATGITADFSANVSHAYLYNSPGVGGVTSFITSPILNALGVTTVYDPAKISNIKAEAGISPIAELGYQVSPPIYITIEDQTAPDISDPPAARNHSQQVLTDALAVQSLYSQLAPGLSQDQLNALIDASGAGNGTTLEGALDALRVILLGSAAGQTPAGNRDAFYANLYVLQSSTAYTSLIDKVQLTLLTNMFASDITAQAEANDAQALATRYALVALNPFVLADADYSTFNTQDELNLYDPAAGTGAISAQYLRDRAAFLERKMWFSTEDKNPVDPSVVDDPNNHRFQNESAYYEDVATGYKKLTTGMMLVGLVLSFTAQGASFDCGKASTDVEKLVCNYPAISKLDDELGKLYQDTLNKADEEQKQRLVTEQKHWLKHTRNICDDEPCLKLAYWSRQAELATFFEPKPSLYKHEADKADAIKQVLETAQLNPAEFNHDKRFCGLLFDDLKQMKGIRFVDPVVQTQSYEDPALDKWKRNCGTKPPLHFSYGCTKQVIDTIHSYVDAINITGDCYRGFGTPPFKIYELPPLKQRGKKRYIFYADGAYGSDVWEDSDVFPPGYWDRVKPKLGGGGGVSGFQQFDPERCEHVSNVSFTGGPDNYNDIIKYRSQHYFMGLYLNRYSSSSSWQLDVQTVAPFKSKEMKSCSWRSELKPDSSTQGRK